MSTEKKETKRFKLQSSALRCQGHLSVLVSRLKYAAVPSISNVGIPYLEGSKGAFGRQGWQGEWRGEVWCFALQVCVGKVIKRGRWQTQTQRDGECGSVSERETGKIVTRNGQQERNTILSVPEKEATDPKPVGSNGAARAQEATIDCKFLNLCWMSSI